jgi:hypothetical protein
MSSTEHAQLSMVQTLAGAHQARAPALSRTANLCWACKQASAGSRMRAGHGKRRQHADTDCADAANADSMQIQTVLMLTSPT